METQSPGVWGPGFASFERQHVLRRPFGWSEAPKSNQWLVWRFGAWLAFAGNDGRLMNLGSIPPYFHGQISVLVGGLSTVIFAMDEKSHEKIKDSMKNAQHFLGDETEMPRIETGLVCEPASRLNSCRWEGGLPQIEAVHPLEPSQLTVL